MIRQFTKAKRNLTDQYILNIFSLTINKEIKILHCHTLENVENTYTSLTTHECCVFKLTLLYCKAMW